MVTMFISCSHFSSLLMTWWKCMQHIDDLIIIVYTDKDNFVIPFEWPEHFWEPHYSPECDWVKTGLISRDYGNLWGRLHHVVYLIVQKILILSFMSEVLCLMISKNCIHWINPFDNDDKAKQSCRINNTIGGREDTSDLDDYITDLENLAEHLELCEFFLTNETADGSKSRTLHPELVGWNQVHLPSALHA